jgi:prefoldin subunit 5
MEVLFEFVSANMPGTVLFVAIFIGATKFVAAVWRKHDDTFVSAGSGATPESAIDSAMENVGKDIYVV